MPPYLMYVLALLVLGTISSLARLWFAHIAIKGSDPSQRAAIVKAIGQAFSHWRVR